MAILNLANKITLGRMLMAPVVMALLAYPSKMTCLLAAIAFALASASDFLDGHIARAGNMVTRFGQFLDPLADKVLICSALIMLVQNGWVAGWIAIVIVCRDLMITGLRAIAADEGVVMAADKYGKLKTVVQIIALIPLILHYRWFGIDLVPVGMLLLYFAVFLTVFSGFNYVYVFYRHWQGEQPEGATSSAQAQATQDTNEE